MPIPVKCACGKALNAPDAMAGRKAKCPACGGVLAIPAAATVGKPAAKPVPAKAAPATKPAATAKPAAKPPSLAPEKADAKEVHQHASCPGCSAFVSKKDAICVQCGMNLVTGRKLSTVMSSEPTGPVKPVAILCLVLNVLLPGTGTLAGAGKGGTLPGAGQLALFLAGAAAATPWLGVATMLDELGGLGLVATLGGILLWVGGLGWALASGLKILKNAKPG